MVGASSEKMTSNPNPGPTEEGMEWQSSDRRDQGSQSQPAQSESDVTTIVALSHAP